jgi:hypothetical protein
MIGLVVFFPFVYLPGNPQIPSGRAPESWSNLLGIASMLLWIITAFAAALGA